MDTNRMNQWLSIAANFGVIVGIIFLVLELQQNRDIATAQVRLDFAAGWRSIDETRQQENFANTLAVSIENPESLSLSEMIQLNAFYWGVIDQVLSAKEASEAGVRTSPFELTARQAAILFFSNDFAQKWWQQVNSLWPETDELRKIMDEEIATVELTGEQDFYRNIKRELSPKPRTTEIE